MDTSAMSAMEMQATPDAPSMGDSMASKTVATVGWSASGIGSPTDSASTEAVATEPLATATVPKAAVFAMVLALVLLLCMVPVAFAETYDTDMVGSSEVGNMGEDVDAPSVEAASAALATSDGTVLWSRESDVQVAMASTTKIMTAVVALEEGTLADEIEVSENADSQGGSSAYVVAGDVMTLEELLYAMMLPSGNDAAMAIAEYYGGGDEDGFIVLMNAKALELGMTETHFSSASGLEDEDNYTTASDYVKLVVEAMGNETFRTVVSTPSYTYTSDSNGYTYVYENTNELLGEYDGLLGIKTGYTDEAGYCLVAAAERDGVELYTVVFGCATATDRFTDTETLLDWGFEHYHYVNLASTDVVVGESVATSWVGETVEVAPMEDVSYLLFDYDEDFDQYVTIQDKSGAIEAGDELGSITWSRDGVQLATVSLVATETVEAPDLLETMQVGWYRFTSLFTGDDMSACQQIYLDDTFSILEDGVAASE